MRHARALLAAALLASCVGLPRADPPLELERLRVPAGFTVGLFARDLGPARLLAIDPRGTLLVSVPRAGRVLALPDDDGDGRADRAIVVADNLDLPHGLAFHGDGLYVAETGRVIRLAYDPATRKAAGAPDVVVADLPARGAHWTRTIAVGADGALFVAVGSSCNNCEERDPGERRSHATTPRAAPGRRSRPGSATRSASPSGPGGGSCGPR